VLTLRAHIVVNVRKVSLSCEEMATMLFVMISMNVGTIPVIINVLIILDHSNVNVILVILLILMELHVLISMNAKVIMVAVRSATIVLAPISALVGMAMLRLEQQDVKMWMNVIVTPVEEL
jgi:hypothetical protein